MVFVCCCNNILAQRYTEEGGQELNISAKVEKNFGNLKKGDKIVFTKMTESRASDNKNMMTAISLYIWSGENNIK